MPHDTRRTIAVAAGLLILAGLAACGLAQDTAAPANAGQCVLLLKNGQIVSGEVSKSGDRYDVSVPGGRISIQAAGVDLCCRSLEEVYFAKRARLTLPAARDHLELAQWCQRQGLLRYAVEELAEAEAIEPAHPLIPLVRRGLELAQMPPAVAAPGGEVRPASFETAELDLLVRQMPPGTVEQFAQAIQPLLVNRCAAAACHGPGSTAEFKLLRPAPGRPPSRRLTERNLSAVLACVDRGAPAASRLLTVPIRAHGSLDNAVFTDHEAEQYKQLVTWVWRVAQPDQSPAVPVAKAGLETEKPAHQADPAVYVAPAPAAPRVPQQTGPSWAKELEGLKLDLGDGADQRDHAAYDALPVPGDTPFPKPGMIGLQPKVQRGAVVPHFVPKDPFDPEIFNRRFFGP